MVEGKGRKDEPSRVGASFRLWRLRLLHLPRLLVRRSRRGRHFVHRRQLVVVRPIVLLTLVDNHVVCLVSASRVRRRTRRDRSCACRGPHASSRVLPLLRRSRQLHPLRPPAIVLVVALVVFAVIARLLVRALVASSGLVELPSLVLVAGLGRTDDLLVEGVAEDLFGSDGVVFGDVGGKAGFGVGGGETDEGFEGTDGHGGSLRGE